MADEKEKDETIKKEKETFHEKFDRICGFQVEDLTSWEKFVRLMYRPTDPSSLGITRLLFGKYVHLPYCGLSSQMLRYILRANTKFNQNLF